LIETNKGSSELYVNVTDGRTRLNDEQIAQRMVLSLEEGWYVNLGIGIPTLASDFIPHDKEIIFHSENGILGVGPKPAAGFEDWDMINAAKSPVTLRPGGCFFSQAESFAMIRGGHLDVAVVGAFQVSGNGDLANWLVPNRKDYSLGNVGGAMDLATGARRVWVTMQHCTKNGEPKIVKKCSFPLTAKSCVGMIFTDLAVIAVTDKGLVLKEMARGWSRNDIQTLTGPELLFDSNLKILEFGK
jgi:3-oxoadipate CoA-transferase, beta subunit